MTRPIWGKYARRPYDEEDPDNIMTRPEEDVRHTDD